MVQDTPRIADRASICCIYTLHMHFTVRLAGQYNREMAKLEVEPFLLSSCLWLPLSVNSASNEFLNKFQSKSEHQTRL